MNEILHVPDRVTSAGHEFSYASWTPGTKLTLGNVSWDSTYADLVTYKNADEVRAYLTRRGSRSMVVNNTRYIKANEPVRLSVPFNAVNRYNYIMVENPLQPVSGDVPQVFYYFIHDVQFIAPNTTQLNIQLDVWQTYQNAVTLGRCYVERGHVGIANKRQMEKNGARYLTVPEGFDIGDEYYRTMPDMWIMTGENASKFGVVISSTVELQFDPGDKDNPNMQTALGSNINRSIPNGASIYYLDNGDKLSMLMTNLSNVPWVSQGIISVALIPALQNPRGHVVNIGSTQVLKLSGYDKTQIQVMQKDFRENFLKSLPLKYRILKKFLTSPYMFLEFTFYNGEALVLKPEYMSESSTGAEISFNIHAVPPNPRASFYCVGYLGRTTYGHAGGITNFPLTSIVNNSYVAYMASNAHSIAYQYQSADWSQSRALAGANLGFNQATAGMGLTEDLANQNIANAGQMRDLSNSVSGQRALLSGANSVVGGIAQGLGGNVAGGVIQGGMGVVNAAADYAITTNQNNQSTNIQQQLMASRATSQINNAGYNRDTNLEYARFASQGDYANAIAGINAKVRDARVMSPTTSGQTGGDAFQLHMNGYYAMYSFVRTLTPGALEILGDFWLRYGYAINRFHKFDSGVSTDQLHCMTHFTYWKMKEAKVISSDCPELYRKTIKGILEKGVTVWKNADDIGYVQVTKNQPLPDIYIKES